MNMNAVNAIFVLNNNKASRTKRWKNARPAVEMSAES